MAAGCALNYSSLSQRDTLFKLPSKNHRVENHILHGVVKNAAFPVENTSFPVLRAVRVNIKRRFTVMCTSHYSYDVHKHRAAFFGDLFAAVGTDRSESDIHNDVVSLVSNFEDAMMKIETRGNMSWLLLDLRLYRSLSAVLYSIRQSGKGDVLGPILNFKEVMLEAEMKGVCLPLDMFDAAKNTGIPDLCLQRYLSLQGYGWGLGAAMRSCSIFRNQMMINPYHPLQLGITFVFNLFDNVTTANAMIIHGGKTSVDVFAYLISVLSVRVLLYGFISPFSYNYRRILRLQESTSRGFMRLFRHPNGSIPPCNRMFEVEAEKSEFFTRVAYCFAAVISTGLLFLYYGYRINDIRGQSPG